MEENKEKLTTETVENETKEENKEQAEQNTKEAVKNAIEAKKERDRKMQETIVILGEGKGVLRLNTPIVSGEQKVEELAYDFTALTGLEYTNAMDSDTKARDLQKITYRQGLALFATTAAKYSERLDMRDIMERISAADAVEAVQLASIFFAGSTRAGLLRISKKL